MQKILNNFLSATFLLFGVLASVRAQAAAYYDNPIKLLGSGGGPIKTIPEFLLAIVDLVFLFGMPIIVMFIVYAGFLFVTAGDNESQISKAKTTITWTLIGAAVLIGAKVIAMAIQTTVLTLGS
jgi:hypothetical protein